MLKRKLAKPALLTQGFLFLAAPFAVYLVQTTALAQSPSQGRDALYVAAVSANSLSAPVSYADLLMEPDAPKIGLQPQVKNSVQQYLKKNKEDLLFIQKQRNAQFRTIEAVFEKQRLPLELKYLAMVESDLKTNAVSRSGAVGMWQLMPETAHDYGLKVSRKYDERRNAYRSTVAAGKYLKSLYSEFNDWLLVIAAYNGGTGRIYSAIKKSGSRNYWALQRFLPAETRGHVQHFISVHYLFEDGGSVVTLTKSEVKKHLQTVSDYLSRQSCELTEPPADPVVMAENEVAAKEKN
jgi:membrane-bound lytic murein transglycosylase D